MPPRFVKPVTPPISLKVPQVRALLALRDGSLLTRDKLKERTGVTPASGTITRVMNGIREGSSSGAPHPGLLELGLVLAFPIDVDGLEETVHEITDEGKAALDRWLEENELPERRSIEASTNLRYGKKT